MKRFFAGLLGLMLLFSGTAAWGEASQGPAPEGMPSGGPGGPPPEGEPGGMPGGGPVHQPESYKAVYEVSQDQTLEGHAFASMGTDENAIYLRSGILTLKEAIITRESANSAGGDAASFYGVGAALLATGGALYFSGGHISTDAAGGAGVFVYGDGGARLSDTSIHTLQDTSGGVHVAGGGTLYAQNLTVETEGGSSAAIRSDRGGGKMVVEGGSYVSNGSGSPAVYVTADISIQGATLAATSSEALCLEGRNTVRLYDSALSGSMPDLEQNGNTWTVILYQSMSGDSQVGKGRFEMAGGSLTSGNGGLFYTTNTQSELVLSGVAITAPQDSEYFLRATGNSNARGWGRAGANGAECTFTAIAQEMTGNVLWDSISTLDFYATSGSVLLGAVLKDETHAGEGGEGYCNLTLDASSLWIVTGDSALTALSSEGNVMDDQGKAVSIVGEDGTVYVQGTSQYRVTVSRYANACDLSGAGRISGWSGDV